MIAAMASDGTRRRRGWTTLIRVAVVACIAALAWSYSSQIDWRALSSYARDASPWLLALTGMGNVPLVWLKAQRMRVFVERRIGVGRLMHMFFASYAADNLVMSQAGPAVRSAMLAGAGEKLSTALGLQFIEKVFEAMGLGLVAVPLALTATTSKWSHQLVVAGVVLAGIGATLTLVALWLRRERSDGDSAGAPPSRLDGLRHRLAEIFAPITGPRAIVGIAAASVGSWLIELVVVIAVLEALDLEVPRLATAALVLLGVNLASLVPGLPANVGPFEAICVLAVGQFGISPTRGLAFALLYHGLHTIPVTLIGLPSLRGLRLWRQSSPPSDPSSRSSVR
jgi:glycosyltransferase AglD